MLCASAGKSKLKFEMRSYEEMVVSQLKKMDEDNQHLLWCQNKLAKERTHSQSLAETLRIVTNQLRKNSEESRILRIKSKNHHEQLKEEVIYDFYIACRLLSYTGSICVCVDDEWVSSNYIDLLLHWMI